MKKFKLLLTAVALIALAAPSRAQMGLELGLIVPNKQTEFGFEFKPAPSFAIAARGSFSQRLHANESRFRWGLAMGYAPLKTTQSAFTVITSVPDWDNSNKPIFFPIEKRYEKNRGNFFFGSATTEFKVLKNALSPLVGLDFKMSTLYYSYKFYSLEGEYLYDGTENEKEDGIMFIPRIGVVYDFDWWSAQCTVGRSFDILDAHKFSYTAFSLTAIYIF